MHDNITCLQMLPNQNQTTRQSTCKLNAWSINQIAIVHAWTETRACTRRNHAWRWHPVQIFPPAQNSRRPCLFSIRDDSQQPPEHRQQRCQQHGSQCPFMAAASSLWLPCYRTKQHEGAAGFFCVGSKWCVWTGEMSRSGCMPACQVHTALGFNWFHFSLAHSHGLVSPCPWSNPSPCMEQSSSGFRLWIWDLGAALSNVYMSIVGLPGVTC